MSLRLLGLVARGAVRSRRVVVLLPLVNQDLR